MKATSTWGRGMFDGRLDLGDRGAGLDTSEGGVSTTPTVSYGKDGLRGTGFLGIQTGSGFTTFQLGFKLNCNFNHGARIEAEP
jgi:hypothetical protein